jgi:AraC-like DNA-binding protein
MISDQQDLLPSLAHLLTSIQNQFDADREAARALVLRAASLLRTEIDRQTGHPNPGLSSGGLAQWQVRRLTTFIEARLDKPILVKELSAVSKLSTTYFCRAFKRTFHETPHSYIVKRRLAKAETAMLTSDLVLSEIAISCGFSDQAHLCKLFRQRYGQSPAAWRRERTDSRTMKKQQLHERQNSLLSHKAAKQRVYQSSLTLRQAIA